MGLMEELINPAVQNSHYKRHKFFRDSEEDRMYSHFVLFKDVVLYYFIYPNVYRTKSSKSIEVNDSLTVSKVEINWTFQTQSLTHFFNTACLIIAKKL